MKRVGFIDYFLDEFHANNYPGLIEKCSEGRYKVTCAYGHIDGPEGKMTSRAWSEKTGIPVYDSIQKVIDNSDALIVLSPDNPEMHEELCDLPLKSGKPVYVDKTFALTKKVLLKFLTMLMNMEQNAVQVLHLDLLRNLSKLIPIML